MAYNGSGTFLRVMNWVNDAAAGIKIRADRHDSEDDNFANGLSQCITKDGQTTITANLPMAGFKHTGVGAATATTDYARYDQLANGKAAWAVAGGTADAITAAYSVPFAALVDGMLCYVRAGAANATTTPTFAPDGLTARTIVRDGGDALVVGDIDGAGYECILRYNLANTRWELLNPAKLAVAPAFTVKANNTSGSASPTDVTRTAFHTMQGLPMVAEGRLTLTSGTPVTTTDVTAATAIYYTPYIGNRIALYDGSTGWRNYTFTERTLSLGSISANTGYDIFIYDSGGGTLTLEAVAWSSLTARNPTFALVKQDGVDVLTGFLNKRYIGSFRTTGTIGQTEDSDAKRYLYNEYNAVERRLYKGANAASWTYSTNTARQANGSTTNQVEVFIGKNDNPVEVSLYANMSNSTTTPRSVFSWIGLDSTTSNSAQGAPHYSSISNGFTPMHVKYLGHVGIGHHYLAWLEQGAGTDIQTWYGTSQSTGLLGKVVA